MKSPTEAEVRKLRNAVFDHVISEESWKNVRDTWMQPEQVQWLREQCARIRKNHEP
jgi:hypothetical protein